MKTTRNVMFALLALLIATPAFAGGPRRDGRGDPEARAAHRAKMEARFKEKRGELLRERIGVDEATAQACEAILDRYEAQRKALRDEIRTHKQALRELFEADSADDAAYLVEVDGLVKAHKQMQGFRQQEFEEVRVLLTGKQQAHLLAALHRMHKRMRGGPMHGRRGGGRGMGPGAGGDRPFGGPGMGADADDECPGRGPCMGPPPFGDEELDEE